MGPCTITGDLDQSGILTSGSSPMMRPRPISNTNYRTWYYERRSTPTGYTTSIGLSYWTTQHVYANKKTRPSTIVQVQTPSKTERDPEEKHGPPRTLANKQTRVNYKVPETIHNLYRINRL